MDIHFATRQMDGDLFNMPFGGLKNWTNLTNLILVHFTEKEALKWENANRYLMEKLAIGIGQKYN